MKPNPALLLAAAAAALPAHGLEPSQVFDKVSPSVWIVRTFDGNERPVGQGSAVVIGPGKVVTNCHVLAKSKQVMVRRRNVMYEAKLEHADTPRDLCILQIEGFSAPAVEIRAITDVKVGEKVFAVGNPRGYEVTLSEGLISGLRGEWKDGSHVIQTTAPFSPGSSGGGLFDAEGRLVGITTLIRVDAQSINFAFPASWIAQVPERSEAALARRKQPQQSAGIAGTPAANVPPGYPAPGTVWLYRFTERGGYSRRSTDITVRADRVDSDLIDESVFVVGGGGEATRRTIQTKEARFLHYKLGGEALFLEVAPYLVAANDGKAPDNVSASGYPLSGQVFGGDTRLNFTTRVRPRDWEDVTVPAGSYRALRYEIDGDREASGSGFVRAGATTRFKVNVWYAPDIQRIVKVEHKAWTNSAMPYTDDSVELLEYRPPR